MIAALKLIAAVAREDPAACTAICENLQWDAINCMFGKVLLYFNQPFLKVEILHEYKVNSMTTTNKY